MNSEIHTSTLPAMSTTVAVISVGIPEYDHQWAMNEITAEVELWQHLFSRFRPESMLSRVNAATGNWTPVSTTFLDLLEAARTAVIATQGRFNPAILSALESHGYDRTIDQVRTSNLPTFAAPEIVSGEDVWMVVEIDRGEKRVRLPRNLRIDFGGIAKGALADRLADRFDHWPGGAISIGGDMCVWGTPPDDELWRVGIEHPLDPGKDIATEVLPGDTRSAIATSSRTKRAWRNGGCRAHHLIDPYTATPIDSSLLAITVCASSAIAAEVITKNLMVASAHGPLSGDMLLDAHWALAVSDSLSLTHLAREVA